jgi:hypothetical protein
LTALGHEVHTQVGSAGFSLDMAVVDPDRPGRYLLGIECDGARYHSARSARDRDRLRESVLEGLGWRIHRIWSTDWFHNPGGELGKVVEELAAEKQSAEKQSALSGQLSAKPAQPYQQTQPQAPVNSDSQAAPPAPSAPPTSVIPYECAQVRVRLGDTDMHLIDRAKLAELLAQVVNIEGPVHWTEAARRILSAAGIQRFGTRIQQAFEEAVGLGVARRLFRKQAEFLWSLQMEQPPVRDRSELPAASRKIEFVAPEEIRRAICLVVEESYGIVPAEVPGAVCRLFGFARVTDEMSAAVEPHRDALLSEGRLSLEGVNLVLAVPDRN